MSDARWNIFNIGLIKVLYFLNKTVYFRDRTSYNVLER